MEHTQGNITVEAKTLELALQKAALNLGVSQERLGYEILKDSGNGIMSLLTGRRVQISAWRKQAPQRQSREERRGGDREERQERPRRDRDNGRDGGHTRFESKSRRPERHDDRDDEESSNPTTPARELTTEEISGLKEEIRTFWQDICSRMAGEEVSVTADLTDGRLSLSAQNEYLAGQLTKNGKLAEAFEHILRKKPRHIRQELPFRIFIDINDIRKSREEELIAMAQDLSAQVSENRKPIVLNYKSPYERKIIHMALDKDERVYTKSIGSGSGRKLMILPISDRDGGANVEENL